MTTFEGVFYFDFLRKRVKKWNLYTYIEYRVFHPILHFFKFENALKRRRRANLERLVREKMGKRLSI